MNILRWLGFVVLLFFTACIQQEAATPALFEVTGDGTRRVAAITTMLAKQIALPSPLQDAYFLQERIGDGVLGPSDYRAFYALSIAQQAIDQWQATLTPLDAKPNYITPPGERAWWVSPDEFASLTFYAPDALTNSLHGWIGISFSTGQIFIFTFTK